MEDLSFFGRPIPYSYILVKAKDINRSRPIVSYFNHPLKKTFNYASRGLSFILKNSNMKSFTMWACKDMTSTLKKYQRDMRTLFGAKSARPPCTMDKILDILFLGLVGRISG